MSSIADSSMAHGHYSDWGMVISWIAIFSIFIAFQKFQRKSSIKPTSMYLAFIVASALEMFGIPLSTYFVAWMFGLSLPEGILWGHTLQQHIGYWAMYIGFMLNAVGGLLIIFGWRDIYRYYWSKEEGEGRLVKEGVYAYIRHPQYTGFILMTLGLLVHWATIPLLIMWPIMVIQYYRLARKEENKMRRQFGEEYEEYSRRVPMFIPFPSFNRS